ncbi:hypothetical protein [Aerolutibacter ruishenii]|uniref:Uncharacterized protein n=1 Tax=Aerolutibacter ruishenii TaxID=686800 RepID=A0A562M0Z5_9GAMM|nr:hypothetical protein [Lysobacter ruishenii]TWI13523.1 hypothetical protein IP93_00685 [Lysobacter ruishenii]
MTPDEARSEIERRISVTPQRVTIAKGIILNLARTNNSSDRLVEELLQANAAELPRPVIVHAKTDTAGQVSAAAEALSWILAGKEAIWSLIHSGYLLPLSANLTGEDAIPVQWTTVIPGSGGESSSWRFDATKLPIPNLVRRAPSLENGEDLFLSEPDLYLRTIGVDTMHGDVVGAFREAVKCFRSELYTASFAMLGKASEGAWLELGEALVDVIPNADEGRYSRQRDVLLDPMAGTMKKIEAVLAIYDHQDLFGPVAKACEVRLKDLRLVQVWSDAVRDSRNTIHFGVKAAVPNTYEKLAALLIGAAPHIQTLYRVRDACRTVLGTT